MITGHSCVTAALTTEEDVMLSMLTKQCHLNKQQTKVNYLQTWEAGAVRQVSSSTGQAVKKKQSYDHSAQSQRQEPLEDA